MDAAVQLHGPPLKLEQVATPTDLFASPERRYLERVLHGLRGLCCAGHHLYGRGLGHDGCCCLGRLEALARGFGLQRLFRTLARCGFELLRCGANLGLRAAVKRPSDCSAGPSERFAQLSAA